MCDLQIKAALARRRLIGQLSASDETKAAALAAILIACTKARPCRSAACGTCCLAFQQAAVLAVDKFIREPSRAIRGRMTAITIVPARGCIDTKKLTVKVWRRVGEEINAAFGSLGLPPAIIGLEASFNEDTTGYIEPHWSIHGHALQLDWLSRPQKEALRACFPASSMVRRPIKCVPLDQGPRARLYPFKPERVRRVTEIVTDHPSRKPYRSARRRELRAKQAVSLAIVEHRLGFTRRLVAHDIDDVAFKRHFEGFERPRDGP